MITKCDIPNMEGNRGDTIVWMLVADMSRVRLLAGELASQVELVEKVKLKKNLNVI